MEQSTKVSGAIIRLMAKANFGMLMETFMKEIGKTIKQTVMEFTCMLTVQGMRDTGKMIFKMDMELKAGLMAANMKVLTGKV